jgi:hypothetical protein
MPWRRIRYSLITPLHPENNQPDPEALTALLRDRLYGPAGVLNVDGTPFTGAELETKKAQIKAALNRELAWYFSPALRDLLRPALFEKVQKGLQPKIYERITMSVYNELRRSGRKAEDFKKGPFKEEVGRECRRLNLADPTLNLTDPPPHFGKILKACDLGDMEEEKRGRKPAKRKKKLGTKTC